MRWAAPLIIVFAACGSSGQQGTGETPRVLAEGLPKVQALAVAGDVIVAAGEQILKIRGAPSSSPSTKRGSYWTSDAQDGATSSVLSTPR